MPGGRPKHGAVRFTPRPIKRMAIGLDLTILSKSWWCYFFSRHHGFAGLNPRAQGLAKNADVLKPKPKKRGVPQEKLRRMPTFPQQKRNELDTLVWQ